MGGVSGGGGGGGEDYLLDKNNGKQIFRTIYFANIESFISTLEPDTVY